LEMEQDQEGAEDRERDGEWVVPVWVGAEAGEEWAAPGPDQAPAETVSARLAAPLLPMGSAFPVTTSNARNAGLLWSSRR